MFRDYVDARLAVSQMPSTAKLPTTASRRIETLQRDIWNAGVAASRTDSPAVTTLVVSALNETIDMTTTRAVARETHPPGIIIVLLAVLPLVCALVAATEWAAPRAVGCTCMAFAAMLAVTIYVILELEYPRVGFIRLDRVDQVLVDLRNQMK